MKIQMNTTDPYFGFFLGEQTISVHEPDKCMGEFCCIHNPSDHHMVDWDQLWRADTNIMERICPKHGVGHPDPDDLNKNVIHACCGCCARKT